MADRDPLLQSAAGKGRLVTGAQHYNPPLLPFERQIIELIGCSESEYRLLTAEAIRRAGPRPAGYEHIPDVRGDVVSIVVSLVIGAALSAVSYVLSPKPKAPGSNEVKQRNLGSITGPSRYTPTFGFDSQAELADYGEPIPIVFGRYTGETGGILVTPKLVWSRMYSYGTQQGVKLLLVVGEQGRDAGQTPQGIDPPDLSGIFLGNGPLDAIYENSFAFYWKRNTTISGFSRVKAANRLYGTRGTPESGDPETNDDIFSCPTARSENDYGFSSAHSLSNNTEIGCFAPIANGSAYRVNWRVITIPELDDQEDDPGDNLIFERIKISGNDNGNADTPRKVRRLYQSGVGRNYSRRMGITALNGVGVSNDVGTEERRVNVGDVIQFTISGKQIPKDFYEQGSVKVDDINSELNEQRIAADDALQVGELFMIGRTTWQVINRRLSQWRPEDEQDQIVELKCIDVNAPANNSIGLVAPAMLNKNYLSDDLGASNKLHAGGAFYPLMRFAKGMVRNTRACEVTEIGIKSSVFQRLNGLCNFQSIPSPAELERAEGKRINLNSGTINAYIRRASVFTIFVRPAGLDPSGQPYGWQPLGMRFAVVGNQPSEIYNYLRLRHPERRQYEFQFIPKNGADMRNSPDDAQFWQLNAAASVANSGERSILSGDFDTPYGRFTVNSVGKVVTKLDLQKNNEFASKASRTKNETTRSYPSSVGINSYLPDVEGGTVQATSVAFLDWYSNPSGFTQGRSGSFTTEIFGRADSSGIGEGGFITRQIREDLPNNQWIEIEYRAQKQRLPAGHYSGQTFSWVMAEYNVKASSGNWNTGQEFIISRTISGSNPFRYVPGEGTIVAAGPKLRVDGIKSTTQPQGRSQGAFEEIFGPARDYDYGYRKSVAVTYSSGLKFIRLVLTSEVYREDNHWTGINKLWSVPTITPDRDSSTSTNWNAGETFNKTYSVSSTNPFAQQYRYTGGVGIQFIIQGVSNLEIAAGAFSAEREFEVQSQYADVSFYGNLVEKSNANSPEHQIVYVNELVSNATDPTYDRMTICGLALKASRNFSNLDQIRMWLPNGVPVTRFHPDDAAAPVGPSNLFSDLVFYLLTNRTAGLGNALNMTAADAPLINTGDFVTTARFLKTNRLFFDGVLGNAVNLRQFVSDTAPFFLCNFVISDGKFSILPALPTTASGEISTSPVQISQLFTAGNILQDSFELEYLGAEERKPFQAVVRYREEKKNQLPQERNVIVRWNDSDGYTPLESFDLTAYCTSEHHARMVGKFFLSIRKRVGHTIRFRTTPYGLNLAPGDYIKVVTEANPYSAAKNGTVSAAGAVTSATTLSDGQYQILYYKAGSEDVQEATMSISGGKVTEQSLWNIIFTLLEATTSENVYMVEQLTLAEDNTVQITASEFPCDSDLSSLMAQDVTNDSRYIFET
ncbi:MAG: hypothetical protein ACO289_04380 [Prochlorococcaceae cyanobacterium]